MEIHYRKATAADVPAMMGLVRELAEFEKSPHLVENTEEKMQQDGFGPHPVFHAFVAEKETVIVGFALHYVRYSTWRGRVLYLEDIYIQPAHRSQGIGRKLMEMTMEFARKQGMKYLVFQVLEWNTPAIEFYKTFKAELDPEWINVIIRTEPS